MKRHLFMLCALLFIICTAATASAIPFQVTDSTLNLNWNNGGGFVSYTGYAMPNAIDLDPGDSTQFTFGRIYFPLAWGSGTADLNVQFSTPQFVDPVHDQASFNVFSIFFFSAGNLTFGNPVSFAYTYLGTPGLMTLDFADISGAQFGSWVNIVGTITNSAAPVPEPATLLLLGMGLIGIAGVGRVKLLKTK